MAKLMARETALEAHPYISRRLSNFGYQAAAASRALMGSQIQCTRTVLVDLNLRFAFSKH
jgi:hypothetical protein